MEKSELERIEEILKKEKRYKIEAYFFVLAALHYKLNKLRRRRHLTGAELAEAIKELAIKEYGPMAKAVLNSWGVYTTEDFGEIVFKLIEKGVLTKTDKDKKEDFAHLYDFNEVFVKRYPWKIHVKG